MKYGEGKGNQDALSSELWNYIQKSEAQAISDLLGLNVTIPKEIQKRLSTSPTSRYIFERWIRLRQYLSKKRRKNTSTFEIEQKIQDLEHQGKYFPLLTEIFSLARGKVAGLEDMNRLLDSVSPEQRSKIALMDWLEGTRPDTFEMIVFRYHPIPKWFELGSVLKTGLKEWVNRFPSAQDG